MTAQVGNTKETEWRTILDLRKLQFYPQGIVQDGDDKDSEIDHQEKKVDGQDGFADGYSILQQRLHEVHVVGETLQVQDFGTRFTKGTRFIPLLKHKTKTTALTMVDDGESE